MQIARLALDATQYVFDENARDNTKEQVLEFMNKHGLN